MLTEQQAIRECKELWEEIEKSGLSKDKFFDTEQGKLWEKKKYNYNCPLCELTDTRGVLATLSGKIIEYSSGCKRDCPLFLQYGKGCYDLGFHDTRKPTKKWLNAIKGLKE